MYTAKGNGKDYDNGTDVITFYQALHLTDSSRGNIRNVVTVTML